MGEGRVLLVLGPSTGGIRAHVGELHRRLVERGWDVGVAGPAGVLDGLDHVVAVPGGVDLAGLALASRTLARVAEGYDLVHAHGLKAGWVGALPPRRGPLVVTVHNRVLPGQGGRSEPVLRWLERVLPRRADAVIATAPDLAVGAADRVVVRPVGPVPVPRRSTVEVRAALGAGPGTALVVGAGRLHTQKGWDVLLEAIRRVIGERRHADRGLRVAIVGTGPQRAELADAVARLGLGSTVVLPGPSANPADELAAATVVVAPSRWESGPLVVAEAMVLGRPVVASAVGFVPELMTDGVDGRVVPPGDVAALAGALAQLLADPVAAEAMGAAAPPAVARLLDPDRLVDEVVDVYRTVLTRR